MGNFKPADYASKYYEIRRDKDLFYEKGKTCVTTEYIYYPNDWFYPISINNGAYDIPK